MAIRRAIDKAKKNMHNINVLAGTLPHSVVGEYKASKVVLRPAPEGTGVIAGGSIRILLESLGVENVVAKSIGSNNPLNMAKAALQGLMALKTKEQVEANRGVRISIKNYTNSSSPSNQESLVEVGGE